MWLRVHPRQINTAADWWNKNRSDALKLLQDEIDRGFGLISSRPQIGQLARNTKIKGLRRIHLSRIRYYLYYRAKRSTVDVLALWHSNRGSDPF